MRTRIFACLLAALLLTPTLASCGNTDEKIGGEITTPDASNTQTEHVRTGELPEGGSVQCCAGKPCVSGLQGCTAVLL